MSTRYHVIGADRAGEFLTEPFAGLREAVQRRDVLVASHGWKGFCWLIVDDRRDGGTVPEEVIEEALASEETR